ncbi:hypothetical protein ACFXGI_34550 [Streptomyces sp. NPDC059355]|uniref:hypothetical protein n=1 Tax=Streptomyces sp. NPDC059355 TaxID=3346811 RepID=UPI00367910A7
MTGQGGMPSWWSQGPYLAVVPEQRVEEHDRDAWLNELWSDPVYAPVDSIADRASSADDAIDWERVRAAVRRVRPVRTLAVAGLGVLPALWWAQGVTVPLAAQVSVDAAWAAGVLGAGIAAVGAATGGRVRRWVSAALLVAAVGGTLIAGPTRHLVAAWIVGA